jgi:hypothetical protein
MMAKKNAIRGEMAFFHALGSGQRKKELLFLFTMLPSQLELSRTEAEEQSAKKRQPRFSNAPGTATARQQVCASQHPTNSDDTK